MIEIYFISFEVQILIIIISIRFRSPLHLPSFFKQSGWVKPLIEDSPVICHQSASITQFYLDNIFLLHLSWNYIWLIFTRTVTPLEIFRRFPQIVFTLLTCVRPINVGFSNRFFCLSDKRCLMLINKKNVEEDKS